MLSVRLSAKEYEELKTRCSDSGARSVSELARRAISEMLGKDGDSRDDAIGSHVAELTRKIYFLDREVGRLSRMLDSSKVVE